MVVETFVALLMLAFSFRVGAHQLDWWKDFDKKVPPCQDLFGHVCVKTPNIEAFVQRTENGFRDDILAILRKEKNFPDPVIEIILKAIVKEASLSKLEREKCGLKGYNIDQNFYGSAEDEFNIGIVYGEMVANGRFAPEDSMQVHCDVKKNECAAWGGIAGQTKYQTLVTPYSQTKNQFMKGVIYGFTRKVGIKIDSNTEFQHHEGATALNYKSAMKMKTLWEKRDDFIIKYLADNHKAVNVDETYDRMLYSMVLRHPTFAGYGNVLFAHTLYKHKDELNPEVADEFENLIFRIMEEIVAAIKNTPWINPQMRKELLDYMNKYEINLGIPKKYRNLDILEKMLNVYRTAFKNTHLDGNCDLEMLTRTHGRVRHELIYSGIGSVYHGSGERCQEKTIMEKNAIHVGTKINVFPAFLHVLNDYKQSLGFKYGYTGFVIAHEIFHGFGLNADAKVQLKSVAKARQYSDAKSCYESFYGRSKFCTPNRRCPIGRKKADEGFADVEGARIVYKLLQHAIRQRSYRQKREVGEEKFEKYPLFRWRPPGVPEDDGESLLSGRNLISEEEWFFYALQLFNCRMDYGSDEKALVDDVHPRDHIRGNAVAQQMKEFTELFGCRQGDFNYAVKDACVVYQVKKEGIRPEATGRTTTTPDRNSNKINKVETRPTETKRPSGKRPSTQKSVTNFVAQHMMEETTTDATQAATEANDSLNSNTISNSTEELKKPMEGRPTSAAAATFSMSTMLFVILLL